MNIKFIPVGIVAALSIFSAPAIASPSQCFADTTLAAKALDFYESTIVQMDKTAELAYDVPGAGSSQQVAKVNEQLAKIKEISREARSIVYQSSFRAANACEAPEMTALAHQLINKINRNASGMTQRMIALP